MDDLDGIFEVIRGYSYRYSDEDLLQRGLAEVLSSHGYRVEREHVLSARDRIDLLVDGRIGIEVKIAGSIGEVTRQVRRYTDHDLDAVGLVTTLRRHLAVQANEFRIPVKACLVGGGF